MVVEKDMRPMVMERYEARLAIGKLAVFARHAPFPVKVAAFGRLIFVAV
jgi:hypothetical protein